MLASEVSNVLATKGLAGTNMCHTQTKHYHMSHDIHRTLLEHSPDNAYGFGIVMATTTMSMIFQEGKVVCLVKYKTNYHASYLLGQLIEGCCICVKCGPQGNIAMLCNCAGSSIVGNTSGHPVASNIQIYHRVTGRMYVECDTTQQLQVTSLVPNSYENSAVYVKHRTRFTERENHAISRSFGMR